MAVSDELQPQRLSARSSPDSKLSKTRLGAFALFSPHSSESLKVVTAALRGGRLGERNKG